MLLSSRRTVASILLSLVASTYLIPAYALSIGDLTVLSFFAQPLKAQIAIPVFTGQELESMQIELASPARFEEEGIEFDTTVTLLNFALRNKEDGTPYIAVTTVEPINELSLSFIVQVNWTGGSFEKSYDVLLTPPEVAKETIDTTNTSSLTQPATFDGNTNAPATIEPIAPVLERLDEPPPRPSIRSKITKKDNGDVIYGPVGPGETLSGIAEKLSSVTSLSFDKRKLILYKLNRHAFQNGRIDGLQAGYKLKFREMEVDESDLELASTEISSAPSKKSSSTQSPLSEIDLLEINRLRNEISEKREKLKEFRSTNENLRKRLKELEEQVADKAHELGIAVPQRPANESLTPESTPIIQ